ncbi:MAG: orotidine 5'-phosphate decarboxylase / HUMPS family protein [Candidatus Aenigmatarchaeota archaeon]
MEFFLALDYDTPEEAISIGTSAIEFLDGKFLVSGKIGVKINDDLFTDQIHRGLRAFPDRGYPIFADMKICHDIRTGRRKIRRAMDALPIRYVTVAANMGLTMLQKYTEFLHRNGVNTIAFTAHTCMPHSDVKVTYQGSSLHNVIYTLGKNAAESGCDAIVLEGELLNTPEIRDLQIRKLVTGVRIDPYDRDEQSRVTTLDQLSKVKQYVDYVVVSSKYLDENKRDDLTRYFEALL